MAMSEVLNGLAPHGPLTLVLGGHRALPISRTTDYGPW
jgi:hypothetical protein